LKKWLRYVEKSKILKIGNVAILLKNPKFKNKLTCSKNIDFQKNRKCLQNWAKLENAEKMSINI